MVSKLSQIKGFVKDECFKNKKLNEGFESGWFWNVHLLGVEKYAKTLLKMLPEADEETVLLSVWLHDLQRIKGLKGDHAEIGAIEAEKLLRQFDYPEDLINHVKDVILSHRCLDGCLPRTLEGQILASADAMSHYTSDFYLTIAISGQRTVEEFKRWALEKLSRDYNQKICFDFAKDLICAKHKLLEGFFRM